VLHRNLYGPNNQHKEDKRQARLGRQSANPETRLFRGKPHKWMIETEENGNEEEKESNPAWMRYMPSRRFLKVRPKDERTDLATAIVKHPVSSNPFSPTHPKNQTNNIKSTAKMISTTDEDQEKTRNKKLRYLSSNPNEAAELISFFNISKSS
jgi:glucan-binding YG repeat protein